MAYSMIRQRLALLVVLLGSGLMAFYVSCAQNEDVVSSSSPSQNKNVVNSSSPSQNGDVVNSSSPAASALHVGICNSSFALCLSDGRKIYVVNDVLYAMDLEFSDSGVGFSGFSSDGYIHVKASHPLNTRYNFLKIKYGSDGGLVATRDDGKTLYNWICDHPMESDLTTASCGGPLRVFDVVSGKTTQIVEVGAGSSASAWTTATAGTDPNARFRFELLGYADYQFSAYKTNCSCQFSSNHVDFIISQGIFQVTSSTWIRFGTPTGSCSSSQLSFLNGLSDSMAICKCP